MLNVIVDLKDIVRYYHRQGLPHKDINLLLKIRHNQHYRWVLVQLFVWFTNLQYNLLWGNFNLLYWYAKQTIMDSKY